MTVLKKTIFDSIQAFWHVVSASVAKRPRQLEADYDNIRELGIPDAPKRVAGAAQEVLMTAALRNQDTYTLFKALHHAADANGGSISPKISRLIAREIDERMEKKAYTGTHARDALSAMILIKKAGVEEVLRYVSPYHTQKILTETVLAGRDLPRSRSWIHRVFELATVAHEQGAHATAFETTFKSFDPKLHAAVKDYVVQMKTRRIGDRVEAGPPLAMADDKVVDYVMDLAGWEGRFSETFRPAAPQPVIPAATPAKGPIPAGVA